MGLPRPRQTNQLQLPTETTLPPLVLLPLAAATAAKAASSAIAATPAAAAAAAAAVPQRLLSAVPAENPFQPKMMLDWLAPAT
jgi:hypothetical protein